MTPVMEAVGNEAWHQDNSGVNILAPLDRSTNRFTVGSLSGDRPTGGAGPPKAGWGGMLCGWGHVQEQGP